MEAISYPALLKDSQQGGPSKDSYVNAEKDPISDSDLSTEVDSSSEDFDCYLKKQPARDTLIIFDYDDTLFPTTWLLKQGLLENDFRPNYVQRALLQSLERHAVKTLLTAMQYGKVLIITNAKQGWVERTCAAFMPEVASIIQEIEIISARSMYESADAITPTSWKQLAFAVEVGRFCDDVIEEATTCHPTVISLGDSLCEQQALVSVVGVFPNCCGKSLKFVDRPHIENLMYQHELVHSSFGDLCAQEGNLDLEVTV